MNPQISYRVDAALSEASLKQLELDRERKVMDQYFKDSHDSPIPHEVRASFKGLVYYPNDPRFRLRLQPYTVPEIVNIITSMGAQQRFLRVGFFEFSVEGITCRLQVYKSAQPREPEEHLFIPFRDKTSGAETYEAARYIDIPENQIGTYELDFKSYNPYCAYDDGYICPVAPKENWLPVEIRAGEKMYRHA